MPCARISPTDTRPNPGSEVPVTDVLLVLATLAFFAASLAIVRGLDRL